MLGWAKIALLLLQVVDKIVTYLQEQKFIDQGIQQEIARTSASIQSKMEKKREIEKAVEKLDESVVDQQLRDLEPGPTTKG